MADYRVAPVEKVLTLPPGAGAEQAAVSFPSLQCAMPNPRTPSLKPGGWLVQNAANSGCGGAVDACTPGVPTDPAVWVLVAARPHNDSAAGAAGDPSPRTRAASGLLLFESRINTVRGCRTGVRVCEPRRQQRQDCHRAVGAASRRVGCERVVGSSTGRRARHQSTAPVLW